MSTMVQKKITISSEQERFLATHKELGFANQSSMVRTALDHFIKESKRERRRSQIARKANELSKLYEQDPDLTIFTAIDGDDFHEPGGNLGN